MPADFPIRTVLEMRALSSLTPEKIPPVEHTLFSAYWVDNLDIAEPKIVSEMIGQEAVDRA